LSASDIGCPDFLNLPDGAAFCDGRIQGDELRNLFSALKRWRNASYSASVTLARRPHSSACRILKLQRQPHRIDPARR
jgi:hypothetical protein